MSQGTPRDAYTRESMEGLGEIWQDVLDKLGRIVDNYEKVNRLMSILVLNMLRKTAIQALIRTKAGGPILDAGSGPGVMIEILVAEAGINYARRRHVVAMDPLEPMLMRVPFQTEEWIDRVRGVFEYLPFREHAFSGIITSFALRDAYSYARATFMLSRVLRPGGRIVFLDISKPISKLAQLVVELYFTIAPVLMGALVMGYKGIRIYLSMRDTLRQYLPYRGFEFLFRRNGLVVKTKRLFLGFVHIMIGEKPAHARKLATNLTGE